MKHKLIYLALCTIACACGEKAAEPKPASNEIWYTTEDQTCLTSTSVVDIVSDTYENGTLSTVSDTYENGRGVIVYENDITEIGWYNFSGEPLVTVTLPEGVTTIGASAFRNCNELVSIDIPASVTRFEDNIFTECKKLVNIPIDRILANKTKVASSEFEDCEMLASVVIPDGIEEIEHHAFFGCKSLASVVIPNSVKIIGDGAFAHCKALKSITIPESVTTIEDSAFYGCTSLESVYCKATTPPSLGSIYKFVDNAPERKIYVPRESVAAYQSAPNWSYLANDIVGYDF